MVMSPVHPALIIAIDGPAAAGKGTLARHIANRYGLAFLDTGGLYRGVAWTMLEAGQDPADRELAAKAAQSFRIDSIEGADIRTRAVGAAASIVAVNPDVRTALLEFQRRFAIDPPPMSDGSAHRGAVLDGRDIGTVVCPDAHLKLFVTASARARAHRRWLELIQHNPALQEDTVLSDIEARDARDAGRDAAPLTCADDAHLIDTTHLSIDAAFAAVRPLIDPLLAD